MRSLLRKTGAIGPNDRPKTVPLTHYLLFKYDQKNQKLFEELVTRPQGNKEAIEKAEAMLAAVQAAFDEAARAAAAAKEALREAEAKEAAAKQREAEAKAAEQAALAAENEAKAREVPKEKQEELEEIHFNFELVRLTLVLLKLPQRIVRFITLNFVFFQ